MSSGLNCSPFIAERPVEKNHRFTKDSEHFRETLSWKRLLGWCTFSLLLRQVSVSGFTGRVSWCCASLTLRKILNMLGALHTKFQADRNKKVNPLYTSYTVHWRIFPLCFALSYISIQCIKSIRYLQGHFSSLSGVTKGIIVNYREQKRYGTASVLSFNMHTITLQGPLKYDTFLRKILNMLDEHAITVETRLAIG